MSSLDPKPLQRTSSTAGSFDPGHQQSGSSSVLTIGWREWISLPDLGLPAIKVKVDTGARTSAIHSSDIERFKHDDGSDWVAFSVFPIQRDNTFKRRCQASLIDIRNVTDSGGHKEERFFISTTIIIGGYEKQIELTLAQRSDMLFRMLLGRTTLIPDILVNPHLSYTLGRAKARKLYSDDTAGTGQ